MDHPTPALPLDAARPLDRRTFLGALAWGVAGVGLLGCEGELPAPAAARHVTTPGPAGARAVGSITVHHRRRIQ